MDKFDTLTKSLLESFFCEELTAIGTQQSSKLTDSDKDVIDDADDAAANKSATPQQNSIAQLDKRRKDNIKRQTPQTQQKLQKTVQQGM